MMRGDHLRATVEIALHGRGGQGAKTCGDVLTLALYLAGYKPHGQPRYTADRMGAPVFYGIRLREDNAPIFDRSWIRSPQLVAVFDDSLLSHLGLAAAWTAGLTALLNLPEAQPLPADLTPFRLFRIDANHIAGACGLMKGNTPILSSVMAGAVARLLDWLTLEGVEEAMQQLGKAAMGNLREANLRALRWGYRAVRRDPPAGGANGPPRRRGEPPRPATVPSPEPVRDQGQRP